MALAFFFSDVASIVELEEGLMQRLKEQQKNSIPESKVGCSSTYRKSPLYRR